mmetsp:Transcript_18692/g.21491  ORF Transcript_18692/g.21491 Transcript_18692/m.21491 type:complete len:95 (-) Transcript_18692:361-645(-)
MKSEQEKELERMETFLKNAISNGLKDKISCFIIYSRSIVKVDYYDYTKAAYLNLKVCNNINFYMTKSFNMPQLQNIKNYAATIPSSTQINVYFN